MTIQAEAKKKAAPGKETLILNAAQSRFSVYGLKKVTMDEIAADVGMGKASLYYYFPTKEELYKGVILREQEQSLRALREIIARDTSASDKLRRYVEQRLHYFSELVNLQVLNLYPWLNTHPIFKDLFTSFASRELECLTEIVREGKKRGEFAVRSPDATATLILHVLQGLRLRAARDAHSDVRSTEVSAELVREMRQLVELLIRGLCPQPSHRE